MEGVINSQQPTKCESRGESGDSDPVVNCGSLRWDGDPQITFRLRPARLRRVWPLEGLSQGVRLCSLPCERRSRRFPPHHQRLAREPAPPCLSRLGFSSADDPDGIMSNDPDGVMSGHRTLCDRPGRISGRRSRGSRRAAWHHAGMVFAAEEAIDGGFVLCPDMTPSGWPPVHTDPPPARDAAC